MDVWKRREIASVKQRKKKTNDESGGRERETKSLSDMEKIKERKRKKIFTVGREREKAFKN